MKQLSKIILAFLMIVCLGLWFGWDVCGIALTQTRTDDRKSEMDRTRSISAFPILMYDSDIGSGFGGKGVVKNQFRRNESFDLMLFGSTKGEQKYSFVFSVPDFEIRQGTEYPLALDVKIEYNKLLKSNFFGIGNGSQDNEFQFPKETSKLEVTLSRAFKKRLVGELGFRYTHCSVYGFDPSRQTINDETPGAGETRVSAVSARLRYDTRDSYINPRREFKIELQGELAEKILDADWNFQKGRLEFSGYRRLFHEKHILAFRFWAQHVQGEAPYHELSKIGDGWTARGYKAERFLDNAMVLTSVECRFPILKKLGGVLFVDTGRVWPEIQEFNLENWHSNVGWGLRYYLANFVVRFDMGISHEGTRIFFNFGHVF